MSQGASGVYTIFNSERNKTYKVFCHFDHQRKMSWTLVLSFALSKNDILAAQPFWDDTPHDNESPKLRLYRMSSEQMRNARKKAKEWRAMCMYNGTMSDRLDTVRGEFKDFDPLRGASSGHCIRVKYVNIRGSSCKDCTVKFFQTSTQFLHIDNNSKSTICSFKNQHGYVPSEDNFGFYKHKNSKFTCSSSNDSTTSWWFGK